MNEELLNKLNDTPDYLWNASHGVLLQALSGNTHKVSSALVIYKGSKYYIYRRNDRLFAEPR